MVTRQMRHSWGQFLPIKQRKLVSVGKSASLFFILFFIAQPVIADEFDRANQIYNSAVGATVLIVKNGEASGVLIDKSRKLVATVAHVTAGEDRVDVIFPVFDRNGDVIGSRKYYRDNIDVLHNLGYYVSARVIVEDANLDVAILQLDSLPEDATEVSRWKSCSDMTKGDPIHIIGRSELGLWRWMGGHFRRCNGNFVETDAVTLPGNSGGPVLTDGGYLLGIHSRSERHIGSIEVSASAVIRAVQSLETARVLSIDNRTGYKINFGLRLVGKAEWSAKSIDPGKILNIWWYSDKPVSPQITLDRDMTDEDDYQTYDLQTYARPVVPGPKARKRITREHDAREYHFAYYPEKHVIDLHDSR